MARRIQNTGYYSLKIGTLPQGCRLCVKGAKLLLLVTGVCGLKCWYCPLSQKKKNKDVVVANEWWIKKDKDVLEEARLCDSLGAGLSGGDPLVVLNRTVKYIRLLKKNFGKEFHIHLYTPGSLASRESMGKLYKAGLDEIRFHCPRKEDAGKIKHALNYDWSVGCEIPVIPGAYRQTTEFIDYINTLGVEFLNLNQLEISETNALGMSRRGFAPVSTASNAVRGSENFARKLLEYCAANTILNVHYCTVRLKDGVQLANRLKRRARNVAEEYDIVTKEGLLVRGAIYPQELYPSFGYNQKVKNLSESGRKRILLKLLKMKNLLQSKFNLPAELTALDRDRPRILTGAWILEENPDFVFEIKELGLVPAVVEEYPTWDKLCVDLEFL